MHLQETNYAFHNLVLVFNSQELLRFYITAVGFLTEAELAT